MSAFVKLNKQDAFVAPYTAHRRFSVASTLNSGSVGTTFFLGTRNSGSIFNTSEDTSNGEYRSLIFDSVNHLYFSNFVTASQESGSYENYNQSTLYVSRSISHTNGENVFVVSVAAQRIGEAINPSTFSFSSASLNIYDNGEGVLLVSQSVNLNQIVLIDQLSSSIVYDTQSEQYNIATIDTGGTYMTFAPNATYLLSNGWSIQDITYDGLEANSPFFLDTSNQTGSISDPNYLVYLDIAPDDTLKTSATDKVKFQDASSTDPFTITFVSSSVSQSLVARIAAQSQSLSAGEYVGNIFYPHGIAVVTDSNLAAHLWYAEQYSSSFSFENSYTIFEHQYRCRIKENEFNLSQNPSVKSGSNGDVYDYVTGSFFQPYITTVGLYNDSNELIAVGKLGQPVPKSRYTDMTFVIKFDA